MVCPLRPRAPHRLPATNLKISHPIHLALSFSFMTFTNLFHSASRFRSSVNKPVQIRKNGRWGSGESYEILLFLRAGYSQTELITLLVGVMSLLCREALSSPRALFFVASLPKLPLISPLCDILELNVRSTSFCFSTLSKASVNFSIDWFFFLIFQKLSCLFAKLSFFNL